MMDDDSASVKWSADGPAKPRLLVVDDQAPNIQVLYQAFGGDYEMFMANHGEQALTLCRDKQPDMVLLDVMMPGIDGFEVCRRLKADPATQDIPVIFITVHNDPTQETRALEMGAVDFITKPINPTVVRARVRTHLTLKFQSDSMRRLAFLDGLTGVFNRRYFDQQLGVEYARAARSGACLSLILIDIDHFKSYNDHYGHPAGDDCLRQVASALKEGLRRPADLVARYGGEEFVCVLPETGFEQATDLAHQLESSVQALQLRHEWSDAGPVVTISLGVATRMAREPGEAFGDPGALVALADAQLYPAKRSGRNRVCSAPLPDSRLASLS